MDTKIRVGIAKVIPFVSPCMFRGENACTTQGKMGINVDLFHVIMRQVLGFKNFEYIPFHGFSTDVNSSDPTEWGGILGM